MRRNLNKKVTTQKKEKFYLYQFSCPFPSLRYTTMNQDCKQCYWNQRSLTTDAIDFDSSVKILSSPGCFPFFFVHKMSVGWRKIERASVKSAHRWWLLCVDVHEGNKRSERREGKKKKMAWVSLLHLYLFFHTMGDEMYGLVEFTYR